LQASFAPEVMSAKQTKAVCVTEFSVFTEMYDDWLLNLMVEDIDKLDGLVALTGKQCAE